jgi:isocitrate dehydrogenase
MQYDHIEVPGPGESVRINADHSLHVPDETITLYILGDGIDVTPIMQSAVIRQPIRKSRPHVKSEVVEQLEEIISGVTLAGMKGFGEAFIRHMDD